MAVVDCPTAAAWLRAGGVDCLPLAAADLETSRLPDIPLIVLPLDRVHSEAVIRVMTAYAARGGKVLAVYWGTLARPEQQAGYAVYSAAAALGVRVVGWTLTGPVVVRPGAPATASGLRAQDWGLSRKPPPSGTQSAAIGPRPSSLGAGIRLDQMMLVRVEPEPSAQVLAYALPDLSPSPSPARGGEYGSPFPTREGGRGVRFQGPGEILGLRNGNFFYITANLFHYGSDSPEARRFFFWVLDQAMPGLAFAQARGRAGAAMAAVIRAQERLRDAPTPTAEAARRLLDEAREAAGRAKSLAVSEQFLESTAAADQALQLTERVVRMLGARSINEEVNR